IGGAIAPEMPDVEVHALRIHCKKLRYLMEFFSPLFAKPEFKDLLRPLKHLQDNLGLFNDYSIQQISLQDFLRQANDWANDTKLHVAQSVGALTAVLHLRQIEERAKIVDSFALFNSLQTQSTFRELFHDGRPKS
ncbi:MAG: CHAD domain-containing protein, partial [Gallionella sp.]|nr:CHAD domain-containing protein [Gallionella sp.]